MRQRGGGLLRQAAAGVLGGRPAAAREGTSLAGARRLAPLAPAQLHEGSNGGSNGAGTPQDSSSPASFSTQAGGSGGLPRGSGSGGGGSGGGSGGGAAHVASSQPPLPAAWSPQQQAALQAAVQAKMASLQQHLEGSNQRLWGLRQQPELLEALGISTQELQSEVLVKYGTGVEAVQALRDLVTAKQAAAMMAGGSSDAWAQRQQHDAVQPPLPSQQQQQTEQQQHQQKLQQAYVPPWRAQQQAEQAAVQQRWQQQQQQPGQQQEHFMQQTFPSSTQLADSGGGSSRYTGGTGGAGSSSWAQRQVQQQQRQQPAAVPRASIRDLLNERKVRLPQYAPGTYNHLMCPECLGGDKGEKSLSVTIEEGSEKAVWNCFRAKCGWTGGVNTRQGINKAYRQFTNDSGFAVTAMRKRKEESPLRPSPKFDAELAPDVLAFFASRGIGPATLARNRVAQETLGDGSTAIAFPYYRDGQLVNIKYRSTAEKKFWQVRGAEKVLFGLDDVGGVSDIVVVEGEMDKLALEEAGFRNVVSVPDGAPARVREGDVPPADQDTKFSYLWNCRAWLDQATKVVIATDNDAPGDALAEELARRLGRERCWRVRWPLNEEDHQYAAETSGVQYACQRDQLDQQQEQQQEQQQQQEQEQEQEQQPGMPAAGSNGGSNGSAGPGQQPLQPGQQLAQAGPAALAAAAAAAEPRRTEALQLQVQPAYYRKDANEVLMKDGAGMLKAFMDSAEPFPIRGLLRFHEYYDDIIKHYRLESKDGQGKSTGWAALDHYYKVVPGELTIVTGVPNSGKSEWIDALLANLAEQHNWCFAMCSMEKKATDHARQLVEKFIGKPFFDLPYARGVRRMSERELDEGLDWIDDRFHLVRYEDDALPAVDWVLDVARAAVYRYGIRGLVIDPYNELDHQRPASMTETEYVSQLLTKIKRFAQTTGVHVWFVAHPRQLREWKGQAPNLYDISGSAHFINKADNGIVVHRDRDPESPDQSRVEILVRKVRNKAAGTIGDCTLSYERVNGRYIDPDNPTGGPRTAQRLDFDALLRQERLQQLQQDEAEAAAGAAASRKWAAPGGAAGATPATATGPKVQQQPVQQPMLRPVQQPMQQPVPVQQPVPPTLPPWQPQASQASQVAWHPDGTVSNDPITDEQEVAAWLDG